MTDGQTRNGTGTALPYELLPKVIATVIARIEYERATRRGLVTKRKRKRRDSGLNDYFHAMKLAERERAELRRLRESGKPYACLEFVGRWGYAKLDARNDQRHTRTEA